jgi:hypothetical protein
VAGSVILGVLGLLAVVAGGLLSTVKAPYWHEPDTLRSLRRRGGIAVHAAAEQLGAVTAAVIVALAGTGLALAVLWPLGRLAHLAEPFTDVPIFDWLQARQVASWSRLWRFLTDIGSLNLTQAITVAGSVVLAVLYARRRWWIPPLVLCSGYLMEKYLQQALKLVVDRGHPPTTLGTWPSGGCARVILVYGLIVYFSLRWRETESLRAWVAGWSLVALAASIQAYARLYNLEHWFTDVAGGLLFGVILLLTMTGVAWVLSVSHTQPLRDGSRKNRAATSVADPDPLDQAPSPR